MTAPAGPAGRCPLCGAVRDAAFRPFCSKRCKDRDLNRWFTGAYAIPAVEADEDDDSGEAADGDVRT